MITTAGPSEQYIEELYNRYVEVYQKQGYGQQGLNCIIEDQVICELNDLHIKRRVVYLDLEAKAPNGVDIFEADVDRNEKWGLILSPQQIKKLRDSLRTIDRKRVAEKGALPSEWFEVMLARRHAAIRQSEVQKLADQAFQIQVECVYVEGRPVRNKADIAPKTSCSSKISSCFSCFMRKKAVAPTLARPLLKDDEINTLRDLTWNLRWDRNQKIDARLTHLVEMRREYSQSAVVDIADFVRRTIQPPSAGGKKY